MSVRIFSWQNFQGMDSRNLLYPCNLRNLWLNLFRFLGLIKAGTLLRGGR
jgi:hypothetical protein